MTRRLTERGRRRRTELLEVAGRLFAERGYHATTVADIVRALGVAKGVFYWYFPSKDACFEEILRNAHADLRRRQRAAIGDETDPRRRIEAGIRASLRWFEEHLALERLLRVALTEERFARVLRAEHEIAVADVAGHLKEGLVRGVIRTDDPDVAARAVIGVTQALAQSLLADADRRADDLADVAVALCLRGLGA